MFIHIYLWFYLDCGNSTYRTIITSDITKERQNFKIVAKRIAKRIYSTYSSYCISILLIFISIVYLTQGSLVFRVIGILLTVFDTKDKISSDRLAREFT